MKALSYKTISANDQTVDHQWYVVDATNLKVGRLASRIATVLRGKHKPSYTPHVDTGDYVIVLNADKINFSGLKMDQKEYITYSGYTGGQKKTLAKELLAKRPEKIMENAVKGMLPKNKLGRKMYKKLFVYTSGDHPHTAQAPKELKLS